MSDVGDSSQHEAIRVLILEDSPADAELLLYQLKGHGFVFDSKHVATRDAYIKALREYRPDIILSDYDLPAFSGQEALEIKKEQAPETPFILVSGVVSEERAIEILTGGATDYVLKKKLTRLLPAVQRALHESYEHRKRKEAEAERDELFKKLEERVLELQAEIRKHEEAETSLHQSRNTLMSFLNTAPIGVIVFDLLGQTLYANPVAIKIYGEECAGNIRKLIEVCRPATSEGASLHPPDFPLYAAFSGGSVPDTEIRITGPDDTEKILSLKAEPLLTPNLRPWGAILISQDITDRRTTELAIKESKERERLISELAESNKELESFSYSVSHDLRAPLRAIDGFSQMLLGGGGGELAPETSRKLQIIRENARKMDRLINDLLEFSRSGRATIAKAEIDMDRLVNDVWNEQVSANPDRNMAINKGRLPKAFGDKVLIRQVLSNLLANAVKFTRKKKSALIKVGAKVNKGEFIYYVKDNGSGFDMNHYDKLFGVFQRLHPESEYEGTGVGLAIVQRIIHKHGGRVWAEGKPGRGATFYFSLPKA